MEVILKKTKITSSVLKQTLRSTEKDLQSGSILGWCLFGKAKYIVCYRTDLKSLSIFPMFESIEFGETFDNSDRYKNVRTGFWIQIKLGGNYVPLSYTSKDEADRDSFIETLKKAKMYAISNGQFFI